MQMIYLTEPTAAMLESLRVLGTGKAVDIYDHTGLEKLRGRAFHFMSSLVTAGYARRVDDGTKYGKTYTITPEGRALKYVIGDANECRRRSHKTTPEPRLPRTWTKDQIKAAYAGRRYEDVKAKDDVGMVPCRDNHTGAQRSVMMDL
jgi:hypothetical protein